MDLGEIDSALRMFMRALEFADNAKQDFQSRVDAGYRGLPPVTVSEAKLVTTGFRPIEQYAPVGADDSVYVPPRTLLGVAGNVSIDGNDSGTTQGTIIDFPSEGAYGPGYYTDAFTAVLRCAAGLYYSDGSTAPVPAGTTYEWMLFFANAAAPAISNGNSAVASAAIPSGLTIGANAVYDFSCRVTTPSGLTYLCGVYMGDYAGEAQVRVQYFRIEAP